MSWCRTRLLCGLRPPGCCTGHSLREMVVFKEKTSPLPQYAIKVNDSNSDAVTAINHGAVGRARTSPDKESGR